MAGRIVPKETQDQIRVLSETGKPKTQIARELGVDRSTVQKYSIPRDTPRPSETPPKSIISALESVRKEKRALEVKLGQFKAQRALKSVSYPDTLIIPDPHAIPGIRNDRFDWLGRYIADDPPDQVVCLGDLADMISLNSFDKGRRSAEGRRYKHDIDAALDAQERLKTPSQKQGKPIHWVFTTGNHEDRIERLSQEVPALHDMVSIDDLELSSYWDEVYPYKVPYICDGVAYCHFFTSGTMERPIGGENPARQLLLKKFHSCVAGHAHVMDHAERTRIDGTKMFGLVAGCYAPEEMRGEAWCMQAEPMWWRGVVRLRGIDGRGYYRHKEEITMSHLEKTFS